MKNPLERINFDGIIHHQYFAELDWNDVFEMKYDIDLDFKKVPITPNVDPSFFEESDSIYLHVQGFSYNDFQLCWGDDDSFSSTLATISE